MTKEMEEFTPLDECAKVHLEGKGTMRDIRWAYFRFWRWRYGAGRLVVRLWEWCFRRRLAICPGAQYRLPTWRRLFEWQRMPRGFRWW